MFHSLAIIVVTYQLIACVITLPLITASPADFTVTSFNDGTPQCALETLSPFGPNGPRRGGARGGGSRGGAKGRLRTGGSAMCRELYSGHPLLVLQRPRG